MRCARLPRLRVAGKRHQIGVMMTDDKMIKAWMAGATLGDLGKKIGITRQGVDQAIRAVLGDGFKAARDKRLAVIRDREFAKLDSIVFDLRNPGMELRSLHVDASCMTCGDTRRVRVKEIGLTCRACGVTRSTLARVGQVFGWWTIVAPDLSFKPREKSFFCRCSCGTTKSVRLTNLLSGASQSCHRCGIRRRDQAKRGMVSNHRAECVARANHWTADAVRSVIERAEALGFDSVYPVLTVGRYDTIEARAASMVSVCVNGAIR